MHSSIATATGSNDTRHLSDREMSKGGREERLCVLVQTGAQTLQLGEETSTDCAPAITPCGLEAGAVSAQGMGTCHAPSLYTLSAEF